MAFAWALVVCLLVAHNAYLWLGKHLAPDTDILALLPVQERDPVLQQSFTHMVDAAQQKVIVLIGAAQWVDAERAADAYVAVLATKPELIAVSRLSADTESDWLASFQPHSLLLLGAGDEAQLRTQAPQFWVQSALARLYSPFSGPKLGTWRDDPFGLFGNWVQERAQETPVRPRDGRLYVADAGKQYVVLPLSLRVPAFAMSAQQAVVPLLTRAADAARRTGAGVGVVSAGVVLHAAAGSEQASSEMSTIGIGSMIGIVLLMWFTFRSFKPIGLILLSIAVGCLGALSVCWLLFDRIHALTLVFGASLIGVAQDYGLYFLCSRLYADPKLESTALLRRLLPGLALTLLTTVIGYMGLALTPFPGLRQMALFSALGLVFAWITVACWFPVMLAGGALENGLLARRYGTALARWPQWHPSRGGLIGLALFAVVAALGCARLGANDDIRLLQNPPERLIRDQQALNKLLDAPTPVQFFLVRGNSPETVLQREESLKQRLDPLVAQHTITGYQALSNWVPSAMAQDRRRALLDDKLLQDGGPLTQLAAQIGEGPEWVAATRGHLLASGKPLTLAEFMAAPASEPWRYLWLGQVDGVYASIVALRGTGIAALPLLQQAGAGIDGVQWVDKVGEISSVLGRYRQYMGWVVLCSYAAVFALLYPRYRKHTWRVLAPTAIAGIATLALLGFASQNLQLFHVLAQMLLLGVGVDYGIFMQEHPGRRDHAPWLAIGLSAANTILSFGLLGLSQTPALRAFGMTMLIGTALVWLIVPCFAREERDA